uniref:Secreted protein n=1 Tax=Steinernema glaseri TaxID=37863 RepID=A0A1I7Z3G7_9BILA
MVAPEYLCVLLLTAPWLIVDAGVCPYDLTKPAKDITLYRASSEESTCIYVLDIKKLTIHYNGKQYYKSRRAKTGSDELYDELLSHNGGKSISGRGYWEREEKLLFYISYPVKIDVYYVAFRLPNHLEWLQSWWPDVLIEEYLFKQYILTSFINCIPLDVENGLFSCYGGDTEGGEYQRESKKSDCRNERGKLVRLNRSATVQLGFRCQSNMA